MAAPRDDPQCHGPDRYFALVPKLSLGTPLSSKLYFSCSSFVTDVHSSPTPPTSDGRSLISDPRWPSKISGLVSPLCVEVWIKAGGVNARGAIRDSRIASQPPASFPRPTTTPVGGSRRDGHSEINLRCSTPASPCARAFASCSSNSSPPITPNPRRAKQPRSRMLYVSHV